MVQQDWARGDMGQPLRKRTWRPCAAQRRAQSAQAAISAAPCRPRYCGREGLERTGRSVLPVTVLLL